MPRLPFTIAKDATFRRPDSAYFDPRAPRSRPLAFDEDPLLAHLDLGHGEDRLPAWQNWLIAALFLIIAGGLILNWMQGGG